MTFIKTPNEGNTLTRRALYGENGERAHRMKALQRITNGAWSTTYKYIEYLPPLGSGSPSPLHMVCSLVAALEEYDTAEGSEISYALEFARYPLDFLYELRGERPAEGDAIGKLNAILKYAAEINYKLRGRDFADVTPGEQRDLSQLAMNVAAAANELVALMGEEIKATDQRFPAPVPREAASRRFDARESG